MRAIKAKLLRKEAKKIGDPNKDYLAQKFEHPLRYLIINDPGSVRGVYRMLKKKAKQRRRGTF